jgi:ribonuclease VapC
MYVDASAIVAMIVAEPESIQLIETLDAAKSDRITAPVAIFEATAAIARIRACSLIDAQTLVRDFLREAEIQVVPMTEHHADLAANAMQRFGKGRNPASLNMGDCFGYAVAKAANIPILFIGDDFTRTDLIAAVKMGT